MNSTARPTCRLLYVEDAHEDQQILREAIRFADVPVDLTTANTAPSALQLLSPGSDFHVLVLDWNLPAVTGIEFLRELRAAQPSLPVVILTGEPRTVDERAAATLGASIILKKPLVLEEWESLAARIYESCTDAFKKATATR